MKKKMDLYKLKIRTYILYSMVIYWIFPRETIICMSYISKLKVQQNISLSNSNNQYNVTKVYDYV